MNIPNTYKEQLKEDNFVPDKILVVYYCATKFDNVEDPRKAGKEGSKQFMADLPECTNDIDAFKDAMKHYGVTNPDDCYYLIDADAK